MRTVLINKMNVGREFPN